MILGLLPYKGYLITLLNDVKQYYAGCFWVQRVLSTCPEQSQTLKKRLFTVTLLIEKSGVIELHSYYILIVIFYPPVPCGVQNFLHQSYEKLNELLR